jgi:hypothetical protein
MNAPIVTADRIVLKNSVEAISCSATWYCTARMTASDAVGMARVTTAYCAWLHPKKRHNAPGGGGDSNITADNGDENLAIDGNTTRVEDDAGGKQRNSSGRPAEKRERIFYFGWKPEFAENNKEGNQGAQTTGSFKAPKTFWGSDNFPPWAIFPGYKKTSVAGTWIKFMARLEIEIRIALSFPNKKPRTEKPMNGTAGPVMASARSDAIAGSRCRKP